MSGTMSQADLVADLKSSLHTSAEVFTAAADADFIRILGVAALAFGEKRPRTLVGTLTLVADQSDYDAPSGFVAYKSHLWGVSPVLAPKYWEPGYPWKGSRCPTVRVVEASADPVTRKLSVDPAPTSAQITVIGAAFKFYYLAAHAVDAVANKTTVSPGDRGLFLLRAQAEVMREMAMRNIQKPIVVRDGYNGTPRNGHPSMLFETFMDEWRAAA